MDLFLQGLLEFAPVFPIMSGLLGPLLLGRLFDTLFGGSR